MSMGSRQNRVLLPVRLQGVRCDSMAVFGSTSPILVPLLMLGAFIPQLTGVLRHEGLESSMQ